ncbi:MAG: PIG-L family deacetylase [Candidatus Krumholzibacteria bacterium]|nr:PIG-L family deacetylase [Candidatus Krumholzibacteria bacterium]
MSEAILFSPHADDESLFAAYMCLRYKPLVVVCFGDMRAQHHLGINAGERTAETSAAMDVLECEWDMLPITDRVDPASLSLAREQLVACMEELRDSERWTTVIAPAWEHNGHEGHNLVADCATKVWGTNIIRYLTYMRGSGRTTSGLEVTPEPGWRALKYRALACYASQIEERSTRPWFADTNVLREWQA